MHANFFLLALTAVGALAAPAQKREVVTKMDVVTTVVWVTATPEPSADSVVVVTKTVGAGPPHVYHGASHHHNHPKPTWSPEPSPPSYTTTVEPEPQPTTTKTPEPVTTAEPEPTTTKESNPKPTLDSYSAKVVFHHNVHRFNHSAPAIKWDQGLADTAQKIASSCYYAHNTDVDGGGYGQNIAAGTPPSQISKVVTDMFYDGEVAAYDGLYGQSDPTANNFEGWGHFSQVVWKDTTHVGCFTQVCDSLSSDTDISGVPPYFTVCNYKNPGNMAGAYGDNVGEPLGWPTVYADYSGPAHMA